MDLDLAGAGGLAKRFEFLYDEVLEWCRSAGHSLHMVHFTDDLFGLGSQADFPASNFCMMKFLNGADRLVTACIWFISRMTYLGWEVRQTFLQGILMMVGKFLFRKTIRK